MDYETRNRFPSSDESKYSQSGAARFTDDPLHEIKLDLEGWREVMLPLASLFRWDKPFYPGVIAGIVTVVFLLIWLLGLSTVTTFSLFFLLVGIVDFAVPFFGPKITGRQTWTGAEESEFTEICGHIANIKRDIVDTWFGLCAMRRNNTKMFFMVTVGFLTCTAWIGNLVDNLLLTYLLVVVSLLLPGIRQHNIASKYLQPVVSVLQKLRQGTAHAADLAKPKTG